jgi:hypothetical protein
MSDIKANYISEEITATKTYSNLVAISVLNSHATDGCRVQQENGTYVVLASGQSVDIKAEAGTVLPDITILTDATGLKAQILGS